MGLKELLSVLFISGFSVLYGQYNEAAIDSLIDEMLENDEDLYELFDGNTNFHFMYVDVTSATMTSFAGREIGNNAYYVGGQLYYFYSGGLFLGASGVWYSQLDPHYRMTSTTIGYSSGTKSFRYRGSYDRYFYSIKDYDPAYKNALNAGFSYTYKKVVGARTDYSFLFGSEKSHQFFVDAFAKIKLFSLGGYDKIRIEPELSFFFGSEIAEYDIGIGNPDDPFYQPVYVQEEKFGLMNTSFRLPLTVSYKDFMFEISYQYNFPRSLDKAYSYPQTQFFRASLGYIISLN